MIFLKAAALVIICVAICITVRLLVDAGDQVAGVVEPSKIEEPSRFRLIPTPIPEPQQDPRFAR